MRLRDGSDQAATATARSVAAAALLLPLLFLGCLSSGVAAFTVPRTRTSAAAAAARGSVSSGGHGHGPLLRMTDEDGIYVSAPDDDVADAAIASRPRPSPHRADVEDVQDGSVVVAAAAVDGAPRSSGRGEQPGRGGRGRGRGSSRGRGAGRGRGRGRGGRGRGRGGGGGGFFANLSPDQLAALNAAKALNAQFTSADTASDVLGVFTKSGAARGLAGSGSLNSVNFSTCLHRLARLANVYVEGSNPDDRRRAVLGDPRFAVLVCGLAEAVAGVDTSKSVSLESATESDIANLLVNGDGEEKSKKTIEFSSREFSNIAWAVAKLKFAPPGSVFPVVRSKECLSANVDGGDNAKVKGSNNDKAPTGAEMAADLVTSSLAVRREVLAVAQRRGALKDDPAARAAVQSTWIPHLSRLAGQLLDVVADKFLEMIDTSNSQELANLLWAFATASRADATYFEPLTARLVDVMRLRRENGEEQPTTGGYRWRADHGEPKPQEHSNSVWALATAGVRGPAQRALVHNLAASLDDGEGDLISRFKPQECSNTAWGVATLLSKREGDGGEGDAEEDAAALRAFRHIAASLRDRVSEFKSQEISNTVWAFATVGFGSRESVTDNPYNDYTYLKSDTLEQDVELVSDMLEAVTRDALPRLGRFRPQELNNLAWGLARLGYRGPAARALFEGVGQQIVRRRGQFTPQDVGTTLWAFATAEYFDEGVYRAAASQLTRRKARSFKPQELSNTVWALATAGVAPEFTTVFDTTLIPPSGRMSVDDAAARDPVTECFAAATDELLRRPGDFKEQEIKDVLWSLSRVGVRHPALYRSVAEHLVGSDAQAEGDGADPSAGRGLGSFSPQGMGNLAWSYAKQAQLAFTSGNVKGRAIGSSGRQAVYETSCLDVGEIMINRLFARIADCALNENGGIERFKAQDLSNSAWAFATLGLLHRGYFDSTAALVEKRLSAVAKKGIGENFHFLQWKGQEIANLIWAYATLNYRAPSLVNSISDYVSTLCGGSGPYSATNIARLFKRQELANVVWACAVLEQYPKQLMEFTYTGLLGSGDSKEIESLNQLYGDEGLQTQAIMSLLYVQMAAAKEAPELDLSLPINFPDGWGENPYEANTRSRSPSKSSAQDDQRDTSSMLELSTSRLQTDVSAVLQRNGFDHIQEHIIGGDDIPNDLGIECGTSYPGEFLSIDIANLEDKIGVEVDGPAHFITVLDDDSEEDAFITSHIETRGGAAKMMGNKVGWEFITNGRRQVNGPTALKHRLLCHLGWCIVHLPFWEWRTLRGDEESEDLYCKDLLEEVIK